MGSVLLIFRSLWALENWKICQLSSWSSYWFNCKNTCNYSTMDKNLSSSKVCTWRCTLWFILLKLPLYILHYC